MTFRMKNDFVFGVTIKRRKYELILNQNSNRMNDNSIYSSKISASCNFSALNWADIQKHFPPLKRTSQYIPLMLQLETADKHQKWRVFPFGAVKVRLK